MTSHVRAKDGKEALKYLHSDVLDAAGKISGEDAAIPKGLKDYIRFPEMAELAGFVVGRDPMLTDALGATKDMPTDAAGLLDLSESMLRDEATVNKHLMERGCGIHGKNDEAANSFTANTWLTEMMNGKDIMSDTDSPVSH